MAVTWNSADKAACVSLSNGDLTATQNANGFGNVRATLSKSSGKWYWENVVGTVNSTAFRIGAALSTASLTANVGIDLLSFGYCKDGQKCRNGCSAFGNTYTTNDVIGVALDLDNGKVWFAKNNVWQASGDPATGANPAFTFSVDTYFPMWGEYFSGSAVTARFSSSSFSYTPPTGFQSLEYVPVFYYFSGYVFEQDNPVSRKLYLHNRSTGDLITTTTSSGDGYYYVEVVSSGSHYIVCLDNEAGVEYNDLIIGPAFPTVSG